MSQELGTDVNIYMQCMPGNMKCLGFFLRQYYHTHYMPWIIQSTCVIIYTVHPKNCAYVFECQCFGLLMFWSIDISVCWHFGLSAFRICQSFILSKFRSVVIFRSTFWLSMFRFVDILNNNHITYYSSRADPVVVFTVALPAGAHHKKPCSSPTLSQASIYGSHSQQSRTISLPGLEGPTVKSIQFGRNYRET